MDDWKDMDLLGNDFNLDGLGNDPVLNSLNFSFNAPAGGQAPLPVGTPTSLERSIGVIGLPEMDENEKDLIAPENKPAQQPDLHQLSNPIAQNDPQRQQENNSSGQSSTQDSDNQQQQQNSQERKQNEQSVGSGVFTGQGSSQQQSPAQDSQDKKGDVSQEIEALGNASNSNAASFGLSSSVDIFASGGSNPQSSSSTTNSSFSSSARPHLQQQSSSTSAPMTSSGGIDDPNSLGGLYNNIFGVSPSPTNFLQSPMGVMPGNPGLSFSPTAATAPGTGASGTNDIFGNQVNQSPIPPPPDIFGGNASSLGLQPNMMLAGLPQQLVNMPQFGLTNPQQAALLYNQVAAGMRAPVSSAGQFSAQAGGVAVPSNMTAAQYQAFIQQQRARQAAQVQARQGLANQQAMAKQLLAQAAAAGIGQNPALLRAHAAMQSKAMQGGLGINPQGVAHGLTPSVTWQSENDIVYRRQMIAKIVALLQKRKPDAPPDWVKKLPDIAKRLEDSLYRTASSLEEYVDSSTLKKRLQDLAIRMGARAAAAKPMPGAGGVGLGPNPLGVGNPVSAADLASHQQLAAAAGLSPSMNLLAQQRSMGLPVSAGQLQAAAAAGLGGPNPLAGLTPLQQQQLQLYAQQGLLLNQAGVPLNMQQFQQQQVALHARAQARAAQARAQQVQAQQQQAQVAAAQAQAAQAQAQAQAQAVARAQAAARAGQQAGMAPVGSNRLPAGQQQPLTSQQQGLGTNSNSISTSQNGMAATKSTPPTSTTTSTSQAGKVASKGQRGASPNPGVSSAGKTPRPGSSASKPTPNSIMLANAAKRTASKAKSPRNAAKSAPSIPSTNAGARPGKKARTDGGGSVVGQKSSAASAAAQ